MKKAIFEKRKFRRQLSAALFFLICLVIAARAMPPHPDLVRMMAGGKIEPPYYLQNREALRHAGVDNGGEPVLRKAGIFAKSSVTGNFKILTLLVDFSDNAASVAAADFDTLIYENVTGSVCNFYLENSYSNLNLVSPVHPSALGWFRAPQTYSYYTFNQNGLGAYPHNAQKLVEDLVDLADPYVDFSQYDNDSDGLVDGLIVVHAGPGAEFTGNNNDIWSHQWAINPRLKDGVNVYTYSINPEYWAAPGDITLGVYSHELGHVFGLPDLYDTDYSSRGVGYWSVMAGGSWNGVNGSSPAHFDAWSKIFLGFVTPMTPSYDQFGVSIPRVETNATVYKVWTGGAPANEYFLLENRQRIGYDAYLPSSGLLIWHIDDNESGNTDEWWPASGLPGHYLVALEQADGLWELEKDIDSGDAGDPYPGSTINRTFSAASTPNSNSYAGTGTQVAVVNISNSGVVMTADIAVGSPQGVDNDETARPRSVRLKGNAPNPFNPETMIGMEVETESSVRLELFNIGGQRIRLLKDENVQPGYYSVRWDGKDGNYQDAGSGVYFCRLTSPGQSETIKMLKIK